MRQVESIPDTTPNSQETRSKLSSYLVEAVGFLLVYEEGAERWPMYFFRKSMHKAKFNSQCCITQCLSSIPNTAKGHICTCSSIPKIEALLTRSQDNRPYLPLQNFIEKIKTFR